MQMYVGITDYDWYEFLKSKNAEEVNFWKPGTQPFKALQENDMFLFKLHHPHNYIVGGGFFVKYSLLPTYLAWEAFGEKNGTKTLRELNDAIGKYRARNNMPITNPQIGCIILTDVFYFKEEDWIPVPSSFSKSIVQGKRYHTEEPEGQALYAQVQERLQHKNISQIGLEQSVERYAEHLTKHRLGQGAFRVVVTDAYQRRCAITGEKTLPVLEAAHIKPYAEEGPHAVNNGLLLKSDFHTLFDGGYITIDKDYRIDVSKRLHEDYGNGKDYYKYHGEKLLILPEKQIELPSKEYLEWHNEHVFLG
ncbi:MAG: HNH endonuclease [Bariatricus sp.]|nr:HNH endonuclease [Bariatricus sp.]